MRKRNGLAASVASAALAVVMAAGGCSPAPGSGSGARSARACATPAAPYLKPGGRAAGGIRWVVRLASCFQANPAIASGQATYASAASPSLTVAVFGDRAWGVDTATGRVRWSRQLPLARRLPAQQPGSRHQDAMVAVLPRHVVISEITQPSSGNGGRCDCGATVADLNPATGAVRHISRIPLRGGRSYVADGKVLLVLPSDGHRANGMIAGVDPATGKTWTRRHISIRQDTGLAVAGHALYADLQQIPAGKAQTERYLDTYSLRTGASLPRLRLPEPSSGIVQPSAGSAPAQQALPDAAGRVLVSTASSVDSVDPGTGALAWKAPQGEFPGPAVAPSQRAVWTWQGSRLRVYDLSSGRPSMTAPVSISECGGEGVDPDLTFTTPTPSTMLCPQRVAAGFAAVRLRLFSLATGKLAGRTPVLPGWSSGSLAGRLAIGITCAGPDQTATQFPGKCSEYDLAAISTG